MLQAVILASRLTSATVLNIFDHVASLLFNKIIIMMEFCSLKE